MLRKQSDILKLSICLLDVLPVFLSAYISMQYQHSDMASTDLISILLIHMVAFYVGNVTRHFYRRGYLEEFRAIIRYSMLMVLFISVTLLMAKGVFIISRSGVVIFTVVNTILVYLTHIFVKERPRASRNMSQFFLITTKAGLQEIAQRMERVPFDDEIVAMTILDATPTEIPSYNLNGLEVVNIAVDDMKDYAIQNVIDEAFISLPIAQYEEETLRYVTLFESMGIDVNLHISLFNLPVNSERKVHKLGGFSVVKFSTKFYNQFSVLLKRAIDIIGACVGLVLTALVGIVVIPLIMLESPGSPIFVHNRVGKNGRIFKFYKFRSMYIDAEKRKKELMKQNEMNGLMFKLEEDPRITKVGKIIRKTSLDELPQFYNVLIGDMSLVGTRPPTEDEYRQYSAEHKRRLSSKPGITGLWQVSGRNEITDFDEVVRLDVEYIDNWTMWLDIKIILKTIQVVVMRRGAK